MDWAGSETVCFTPAQMQATWDYAERKAVWSRNRENYNYLGSPELEVKSLQYARLFEIGTEEALGAEPSESDPYEVRVFDLIWPTCTLGMRWTRNWATPTWIFPHKQRALADFYILGTSRQPAQVTILGVATKAQIQQSTQLEYVGKSLCTWLTYEELAPWDVFRDSLLGVGAH